MGQKVHPNGFRLGVINDWSSVWYAGKKDYAELLHEDLKLRDYVKKRLYNTGVARIDIERAGRKAKVHVYTARPGLVIGQRGQEVDKLRFELEKLTGRELLINIHEVLSPELSAQLVAESVAGQLERRVAFRRAMKKTVQNTMRLGAKGIRLRVAGRLNGAEIARAEQALQHELRHAEHERRQPLAAPPAARHHGTRRASFKQAPCGCQCHQGTASARRRRRPRPLARSCDSCMLHRMY